jgi:hypothetical protein
MKGEKSKTDQEVLQDCWGRWTANVALFAQGRRARHRLDPCDYAALRRELMAVCRVLAKADGPERRFYAGLEEMVNPWLYLREFEGTDRETLAGLLVRCREVESKLSGRKRKPASPRRWVRALALAVGGAVTGGLIWVLLTTAGRSVLYAVRDSADTIWLLIRSAPNWQKGSVIAMIVAAAAIFIASRTARA